MMNRDKTDALVQNVNSRLMVMSPMMACMTGNQDRYHELTESVDMWAELDTLNSK